MTMPHLNDSKAVHAVLSDAEAPSLRGERKEKPETSINHDLLFPVADPNDNSAYLRNELYARMQKEPDLFDWLQKAALDGIWYWDLEQPDNEWMSPEFKNLFGYSDEEVPNTPSWWQANIFPEDGALALKAFHSHVERGTPYDQVVRYRHKDGSTIWVRCRGKADIKDGKPVRMLGAHSDVTPLMKDLKKKEAVLDLLTSSALDGFWDWDIATGHTHLSDRWKRRLGYEVEEIEDTLDAWKSLVHPEDLSKFDDALNRHMDELAPFNVVLRYKRKDGSWAHMLAQGVAQKDEKGNWVCMFGTHTDVSDLEEARVQARAASIAKSTFLATMSHEIRTPLNAVLGMAQVLLTTELTGEQRDCLTTLHSSGSHLLSLLNNVLDFSQIEAGRIDLVHEKFDVQKTLRDVLDVMRQETNSKGLAVTFDTSVPAGAVFTGDSERLRQVVFNLLGNAVKFTSEGIVGLKIEPRENNGVSGISIHVYDTGVGMNPEQQKLVFEEFTQANNEIRRKYGGTGLGLSICRKLVRAMQGNLSLESEVDKGSTFSLWIPGLQNPEETKSDSPHPSVGLYDTRCPTAVQTLANGIKAAGRNVVTCSDAEQMKDLVGREKTQTIVVARQTEGEDINAWLLEFLKQDVSRRLIAVGGSRRLMREFSPDQVIDVPDFPTSDELDAALAAKKRQKKPFRKHSSQEDAQILQVLIVEDNLINQKVMTKFLTRFPCEVMVANNGQEAVDLVSRINNLDLIFMDCQMPIMDGMEATKIIRANGNHIPILALTANASTSDRDECLEAGMDGFLTKPVSMESIAKVFERVLTGEGDF